MKIKTLYGSSLFWFIWICIHKHTWIHVNVALLIFGGNTLHWGICSTTPLLWCYSAAKLIPYIIYYCYTSLVYYFIPKVLGNIKLDCYLLKTKGIFMPIYCSSISFRIVDDLPEQGWSGAYQDRSPKNVTPTLWLVAGQESQEKLFLDDDWSILLAHAKLSQVCVTWHTQQRWQIVWIWTNFSEKIKQFASFGETVMVEPELWTIFMWGSGSIPC